MCLQGMVCTPQSEARVQCVVRYHPPQNFTDCRKCEVTLPSSTAVKELVVNVARLMKLEPLSIQLRLQTKTGLDKVFKESSDGVLSEAGFCTELGARNSLVLEGIDGLAPRTAEMAPEAEANETVGSCGEADSDAGIDSDLGHDGGCKTLTVRNERWTGSRSRLTSATTARRKIGSEYKKRAIESSMDRENRDPTASSSQEPAPSLPSSDNERFVYTFSMPSGHVSSALHGFIGLVNQAMTCYLNSLLQALYMTPEFRNAVYNWKFVRSEEVGPEVSIPFQLQKLFVNLQTSSKTAVETTELTQSFGWKSSDVWQQQDIQELCRVMFDALETQFKDTVQADLINQLYEGKMMDYVKCSECGTEKSREDTFLDIPLSIKPFGSNVAYRSVEEALEGFVQPEILDGNNQYFCESCNKKCNAQKGLKFTKFPYILTLHLKRFDFDYTTTNRIKLNDKVEFPMTLNLNSFVDSPQFQNYLDLELHDSDEPAPLSPKCDDSSKADSVIDDAISDCLANNSAEPPSNDFELEVDEGIDVSDTKNSSPLSNRREAKGPYVYELYSIMIHSGSASGGHYYAYIKDLAENEWYCFNDQIVSKITQSEIKKTFGGGPARSFYSGAYSSSTNAYMLMYRQIDSSRNCLPMTVEEFPEHIKEILEEMREKEEEERAFRARQESMVKLNVCLIEPQLGTRKEEKISVDEDCTFSTFFQIAYERLNASEFATIENCRLVAYNSVMNSVVSGLECSFEDSDDKKIGQILHSISNDHFIMQIKEPTQIFLPCRKGDVTVPAYHVNAASTEIREVQYVHLARTTSLLKIKHVLSLAFHLKSDLSVEILDEGKSIPKSSNEETTILLNSSSRIFFTDERDSETHFLSCVRTLRNVVVLNVVIPDTSEELLDKLLIPPLQQRQEDTSDITPTGDRQLLGAHLSPSHFNEVPDEDNIAHEGVCTSDQSASEDSSLADSERTMVGDPQNEAHFSSASDSEMRELASDEGRDARSDQDLYIKITPFTYKVTYKMLAVTVDRNMNIKTLKKRLEEYVGVDAKYMLLVIKSPHNVGELIVEDHLKSCRDNDTLHVKLFRVPEDHEHTVKIHRISPNNQSPREYLFEWIITTRSTVGNVKKALYKYMKNKYDMDIPYENFRLRRKHHWDLGRVLMDDEYIVGEGMVCDELFVEELSGPEHVNKMTKALILTKRWQPESNIYHPYNEIALDVKDISCLKKQISEMSGIPIEHLELSEPFTFSKATRNSVRKLRVTWERDDHEGIKEFFDNDNNEFVVMYRDDRDAPPDSASSKLIGESGRNGASGSETLPCRSNVSDLSFYYSCKKERELKIRAKVPKPE